MFVILKQYICLYFAIPMAVNYKAVVCLFYDFIFQLWLIYSISHRYTRISFLLTKILTLQKRMILRIPYLNSVKKSTSLVSTNQFFGTIFSLLAHSRYLKKRKFLCPIDLQLYSSLTLKIMYEFAYSFEDEKYIFTLWKTESTNFICVGMHKNDLSSLLKRRL